MHYFCYHLLELLNYKSCVHRLAYFWKEFLKSQTQETESSAAPQCREEVPGWAEQKVLGIGCYRILWVSFAIPRYPDQSKENSDCALRGRVRLRREV